MSKISELTQNLREFNNNFLNWIDNEAPKLDVFDLLRHYNTLVEAHEAFDETRKVTAALLERMSRTVIPEAMGEKKVKTLPLEDLGRRFTVSARLSCSMTDKDRGFQWLRENGQGGLIQPTVNSSSLSSFAKSFIEETGRDLPPDVFKISTMFYTSRTKIATKNK